MSNAMSKNVLDGIAARVHVAPPSRETRKPLSLPDSMKFGSFGSSHIAWLSPPGLAVATGRLTPGPACDAPAVVVCPATAGTAGGGARGGGGGPRRGAVARALRGGRAPVPPRA